MKKYGYFKGDLVFGSWSWSRNGEPIGTVGLEYRRDEATMKLTRYTNQYNGSVQDLNYTIQMLKTPCTYGGFRYWFRCGYCYKRVGVIYLAKGMRCRKCANLCYQSQKAGRLERSIGSKGYMFMLDEERASMRITHYAGKPTKRYSRWLKRADRTGRMMMWALRRL